MNTRMIAAALMMTGMAVPAFAQQADAPNAMPTAPMPQASPAPADDPNAGQPMGNVPPSATSMAPANPNAAPDPMAAVGSSANPVVVGGNMTAPPATPKDYPLCTRTIQDSCMNPGQAHHRR